jgi:two-component system phosphate regulon response regulator OmpR
MHVIHLHTIMYDMKQDHHHLLVVDDDQRLRKLLEKYLKDNTFQVTTAANAREARKALVANDVDLIVLDIMMPGESGFEFAQSLSQKISRNKTIPILFLTAMGEVNSRIKGLEYGADDYVVKPFESKELLLRIQKILRRIKIPNTTSDIINLGDYSFDITCKSLAHQGAPIHLTSVEADLLHTLASHQGVTISRDELAERSGVSLTPRTIDVQVTRLRRKIELDPRKPRHLKTTRHQGYVLWPSS